MKLILSVEPVRFPLTGIGRYTYELALRLQQNREITDLQFLQVGDFYRRCLLLPIRRVTVMV